MIRAGAFRGATAWEAYIGPAWVRFAYPTYWLYSRNRADFVRTCRANGFRFLLGAPRGWLFAWPLKLGWSRNNGE